MKIHMMAGLPASGKSTAAKKLVKLSGSAARINRDDLRAMLFNSEWSGKREKIIVQIEKAIAGVLIKNNMDAVIDDTNLTAKHEDMWFDMAMDLGVSFKKDFQDVGLEECIRRDKNRELNGLPFVGRNVIVKMAAKNKLLDWPDRDIVLVDIDGTLADGSHREHYVKQHPKDWDSYLSECGNDTPVIPIFKWVSELSKDYTIVIVSGRGAEREDMTLEWFEKVWTPNPLFPELEVPKFPVFQYFFRNKGDRRPDDEIKLEVLDLLPRKPVLVIDDRPRVIRAWQSKGLKVIPVRGAIEEF